MQSTSPEMSEVSSWRGRTMIGGDGEKIGTIDEIYLDA
jgi:sporulation protein YlmC with PRC-barrel domain